MHCQKGSCADAYEEEEGTCVVSSTLYVVGLVALLLVPCVPRSELWGIVAQSHNRLGFLF